MPVDIQFIEDDIDEIRMDDIDDLSVQAMGNVYIKYADSNAPASLEETYDEPVTDEHIHAYIGIYIGIQEPIAVEGYNWCVRDLSAIQESLTNLTENKQDKLSQTQLDAVNSGIDTSKVSSYDNHITDNQNPHNVTKSQVGLGNVVNTGDNNVPEVGGSEKFTTGGAYTLKTQLEEKISQVEAGLGTKQDLLVSGQNIKTINGESVLGSGDLQVGINPRVFSLLVGYEEEN